MEHKKRESLTKNIGQWPIFLAIVMSVATGTVSFYTLSQFWAKSQSPAPVSPKSTPAVKAVGALGRLEPQGEVINLSAPSSLEGTRITQLLVKKGTRVRKGQAIAILDGHARRRAALQQAQKQVQVALARLAQVKAGAKAGDITAQKATITRLQAELHGETAAQKAAIARLEADLANAQSENRRYQHLYKQGAITASDSDTKRLRVKTVQQQLKESEATLNRTVETIQDQLSEAKAKLTSIAEVRPTDVQVAQSELDSAITAVKEAQADLDLTYIRAPKDGQILEIHTWPGESISSSGIAELGQTNQMYVVAEVYETDIQKVHLGQSASITSTGFSGTLRGTVTEMDLQVTKQKIVNINPTADTDRKVVEVKIRLDDPGDIMRVAALTGLQVQVVILV